MPFTYTTHSSKTRGQKHRQLNLPKCKRFIANLTFPTRADICKRMKTLSGTFYGLMVHQHVASSIEYMAYYNVIML